MRILFFFTLQAGKQNTIAAALSRTPEQTHLEYRQLCTETVPV